MTAITKLASDLRTTFFINCNCEASSMASFENSQRTVDFRIRDLLRTAHPVIEEENVTREIFRPGLDDEPITKDLQRPASFQVTPLVEKESTLDLSLDDLIELQPQPSQTEQTPISFDFESAPLDQCAQEDPIPIFLEEEELPLAPKQRGFFWKILFRLGLVGFDRRSLRNAL